MSDLTLTPRPSRSIYFILFFLTLYAFTTYSYATLRFGGAWNENDTLHLTHSILSAQESGSLLNTRFPYGNGFTFQSVVLFLMELSGVSIQTLQIYILPSIACFFPVVAFITYRSFTRNNVTALLAALLLYLQPDFLFVTWRGSHEKITWMLALLMLFLLTKSFNPNRRTSVLARYMLPFYLIAFAFVSSNAFFASSFIVALAVSTLTGMIWLFVRARLQQPISESVQRQVFRLFFMTLACGILLYLFFFHLYPPANSLLNAFGSMVDAVTALLLNVGPDRPVEANAYNYIAGAWVDPWLYPLLNSLSLLILALSPMVWLRGVPRFLLNEISEHDLPMVYLWLIYPAFVLQLVASVFVDRVSILGSNIQVRLFTPLMLISIPLVAHDLANLLRWAADRRWAQRGLLAAGVVCFALFSTFALMKSTNEPLVNNNWIFTTHAERLAGQWVLDHSVEPMIWEGDNVRLRFAMPFYDDEISPDVFRSGLPVAQGTRYFVVSEIERALWLRRTETYPYLEDELRIYDNGQVQVFYRRPRNAYQR